jgi:sugar fermentation stimulation protein A
MFPSARSSLRGVPMKLKEPLRQGEFVKRYKRFFADVKLDGELVVAHVPNTGSLKSCLFTGAPCLVSESTNPARKLKATLHFIKTPTTWVGVDTSLPNSLVHEAWETGLIDDWKAFAHARREFKISKESRLDLVLAPSAEHFDQKKNLHHIEVKNVTYAEGGIALFPDAVTERGQKHLRDLMGLKKSGFGAEIVFVVQREDCERFAPADAIDPEYGKLLREAVACGVRVRALTCAIDPKNGVSLAAEELPLEL